MNNNKVIWSADQQLINIIFENLEKARYSRTISHNVRLSIIYYQFTFNTIKSQLKRNKKNTEFINSVEKLFSDSKILTNDIPSRNTYMKNKLVAKNNIALSLFLDKIDTQINEAIFVADLGFKQDNRKFGTDKLNEKYDLSEEDEKKEGVAK